MFVCLCFTARCPGCLTPPHATPPFVVCATFRGGATSVPPKELYNRAWLRAGALALIAGTLDKRPKHKSVHDGDWEGFRSITPTRHLFMQLFVATIRMQAALHARRQLQPLLDGNSHHDAVL